MNVIDQAAERLRGHWMQGRYNDENGNMCLLGAMNWYHKQFAPACGFIVHELRAIGYIDGIADFNDDPSTTEEDVLLLMKRASARLDEMDGAS